MLKHKIVFVSKDDQFKVDRAATDKLAAETPELQFCYVARNTQPLACVYNAFLDEKGRDWDFVYFVHADVELDFKGLAEHVESVKDKYEVMGLCGCEKLNVSQRPLNWFCGSRPFPGNRWGCVSHGELGGQTSFFSAHSPDVTDREVACVDGLCLIISRKAADAGMRFDPSVGDFDCYDTDISMQTVLKYGFRLGVVVRKDLRHYSVGKSILTQEFLKDDAKLRAKWGFPIPPPTPALAQPQPPPQQQT